MTYSFHLLLPQLTCSTVVVGIASNLKLSLFAYSPYLSPSPLLLFLLLLIFILIHPYTPTSPAIIPFPDPYPTAPLYLHEATDRWNVLVAREMRCIVYRALTVRLASLYFCQVLALYVAYRLHLTLLLP